MDDIREQILVQLMEGRSLSAICRDKGMPNRSTVQRWQNDDAEFDAAVTHAREEGFQLLAEQARLRAHGAEDAAKGRLAFDADRWYLGKLSNAFSDNKAQKHEVAHGLTDEAKRWLGLG
jgi:hypothetical protein